MKTTTPILLVLTGALTLGSLLAGCSGAGTTTAPGDLAALQAAANDHMTTVMLLGQWFSIMYYQPPPGGGCARGYDPPHHRRGDPPGSLRYHGVMSDCTVVDAFILKDTSGSQVIQFPDGRRSEMNWGTPVGDHGWLKTQFVENTRDDAHLEYEEGNRGSPNEDQYEQGTATLASGTSMGFKHQRNLDRDFLVLTPQDGSRLSVTIPLAPAVPSPFWPVFAAGAAGTFRNSGGATGHFRVWGAAGRGWEQWQLTGADGITGLFTLDSAFWGSGLLKRDGKVLGSLHWNQPERGTLEPVGAGAVDAVPCAAARAFAFDGWIGNTAALGPMPLW